MNFNTYHKLTFGLIVMSIFAILYIVSINSWNKINSGLVTHTDSQIDNIKKGKKNATDEQKIYEQEQKIYEEAKNRLLANYNIEVTTDELRNHLQNEFSIAKKDFDKYRIFMEAQKTAMEAIVQDKMEIKKALDMYLGEWGGANKYEETFRNMDIAHQLKLLKKSIPKNFEDSIEKSLNQYQKEQYELELLAEKMIGKNIIEDMKYSDWKSLLDKKIMEYGKKEITPKEN